MKRGEPDGEIREQLRKEGYTEEDISSVFKPHHYDMRSWYLFFGIIVSLAGLYIILEKGGSLILLLGLLLFYAYHLEIKRLKRLS